MEGGASGSNANSMSNLTPSTSYAGEIQQMMIGFGDCPRPLMATAAIVEEIVNDQESFLIASAFTVQCRQ